MKLFTRKERKKSYEERLQDDIDGLQKSVEHLEDNPMLVMASMSTYTHCKFMVKVYTCALHLDVKVLGSYIQKYLTSRGLKIYPRRIHVKDGEMKTELIVINQNVDIVENVGEERAVLACYFIDNFKMLHMEKGMEKMISEMKINELFNSLEEV